MEYAEDLGGSAGRHGVTDGLRPWPLSAPFPFSLHSAIHEHSLSSADIFGCHRDVVFGGGLKEIIST